MAAAALLLLLAQSPVERWIDALDSPDAHVRREAAWRLLAAGDEAAAALDERTFDDPEAQRRATELLQRLRVPHAILRAPTVVSESRNAVLLELVIVNPRPLPLEIEPVVREGKGFRRNPRWTVELHEPRGRLHFRDARLYEAVEVGGRDEEVYAIPVRVNLKGVEEFRAEIRYHGDDFELHARSAARVGHEPAEQVRRDAFSAAKEDRAAAVDAVRLRLRGQNRDGEFTRLLRVVARSPHRDVKIGLAEALRRHGRRGDSGQVRAACALALDRDLAVARKAHAAFVRVCAPRTRLAEAHRMAAKTLARREDPRAASFVRAIAAWKPDDRRRFYGGVLDATRAAVVHEHIASLLRQEGIPVEPGAGGLVPRSQIRKLRR